jgi:methyltransferase family protein
MANPLETLLIDPAINANWHMQMSERVALMYVLSKIKPDISIEIGTFLGGSLRPIAATSRQVYTFDIDDRSCLGFSNVTFITGDSAITLPHLIDAINSSNQEINFILVDGGHSEAAVRNDLASCLRYRPKSRPTVLLMHDSSNPAVRKGIIDAPWADNPHAHCLDVDFVPGLLFDREDIKGQIWGGLAAAVMLPEKRSGNFSMQAGFEYSLSVLLDKSVYSG